MASMPPSATPSVWPSPPFLALALALAAGRGAAANDGVRGRRRLVLIGGDHAPVVDGVGRDDVLPAARAGPRAVSVQRRLGGGGDVPRHVGLGEPGVR
jgi:hypothetical protein